MRLIVRVRVPGKARTKGSMVAMQKRVVIDGQSLGVGRARLKESTAYSKEWRAEVAWLVRQYIRSARPYEGAVRVSIMSFLPQPKSNRDPHPTAMRTGDVDKIARNVLDALTDSGAIKDDSQVVAVHSMKAWAASADDPYTLIDVETYEEA